MDSLIVEVSIPVIALYLCASATLELFSLPSSSAVVFLVLLHSTLNILRLQIRGVTLLLMSAL